MSLPTCRVVLGCDVLREQWWDHYLEGIRILARCELLFASNGVPFLAGFDFAGVFVLQPRTMPVLGAVVAVSRREEGLFWAGLKSVSLASALRDDARRRIPPISWPNHDFSRALFSREGVRFGDTRKAWHLARSPRILVALEEFDARTPGSGQAALEPHGPQTRPTDTPQEAEVMSPEARAGALSLAGALFSWVQHGGPRCLGRNGIRPCVDSSAQRAYTVPAFPATDLRRPPGCRWLLAGTGAMQEKDKYLGGYVPMAFFGVGAVASLLVGWLTDSTDRRKLFIVMTLVGQLGALGTVFVKTFWQASG